MPDPRISQYAQLLVERCVHVEPGWQVMINSTPLARPLVEEVLRYIARRGAYPITRIGFHNLSNIPWLMEAPEGMLDELAPIERYALEHIDAQINIGAPENTRENTIVDHDRLGRLRKSMQFFGDLQVGLQMPWVFCQYPTPALAQEAGMSLAAYEDFLYGACLLDWDE